MNDPSQTTPIHPDEALRLENMFPGFIESLKNAASDPTNNREWLAAIPVLARQFIGQDIEAVISDGMDYFTSSETRGEATETMTYHHPMVKNFADHFKVDINLVTKELIAHLPAAIDTIGAKLAKDLTLNPAERAIKKLRDASKLLKALAKTKFKGDPVRSKFLKSAARTVSIHADDLQHGS